MYEHQLENIRAFASPEPVREISVVHNRYFTKNKIALSFAEFITNQLPEKMVIKSKKAKVLPVS
jgi:hypothetical protein